MTNILFKPRFITVLITAGMLCTPGSIAMAQVDKRLQREQSKFDEQVGIRNLPEEYVPKGIMYKGFLLKPELSIQNQYNTNIYGDKNGAESDYVVNIKPQLLIDKQYDVWSFAARGQANIERFATFDKENKVEYYGEFSGNYNPNSRWEFPFNFSHTKTFKERGSPQNAGVLEEPTAVEVFQSSAGFVRNFNRLSLQLLGKYNDYEFEDGETQNTGQKVVFSDNNRSGVGANLRLSYLFPRNVTGDSGHTIFLDVDTQKLTFEKPTFINGGFNGTKKDSTNYNVIAGFATSYKGILEGSIGAGYLYRKFDDSSKEPIKSLDFAANIKYAPTRRFALDFNADRFITQSSDTQSGIVETQYSLSGDYSIYHNIYWKNTLALRDYEFSDNDRNDKDYRASSVVRYHINQNLYSDFGVTHQIRDSSIPDREFDRTIFLLSLTGAL